MHEPYTQRLAEVVSFDQCRNFLAQHGIMEALQWKDFYTAFIFCETCKIMRIAEVLQPLHQYTANDPAFVRHLTGEAMRRFRDDLAEGQTVCFSPEAGAKALAADIGFPTIQSPEF